MSKQVLAVVEIDSKNLQTLRTVAEEHGYELIYDPKLATPAEPEIVFGLPSVQQVRSWPAVRWVQAPYAGVDKVAMAGNQWPRQVVLTNGTGVFGVAGGEHVLAMMLYFARGIVKYRQYQQEHEWNQDIERAGRLAGRTLCVVGMGDIGRNIAKRAKAFDMNIIGVKRRIEDVPFVDEVVALDGLDAALVKADHVALALPLTPQTEKIIDAHRLALMKGRYLYNVGRGRLVDQDALVRSLQNGTIAGAGLDVFVDEPLPTDNPLWDLDNVLITPHIGADTPWDMDGLIALFAQNLGQYVQDEPLINVVDLDHGY